MVRRRPFLLAGVVLLAAVTVIVWISRRGVSPAPRQSQVTLRSDRIRQTLFAEVQPVKLANCTLERFGEANDGGYLLCGNLLDAVRAGYSYGISGYDGWGCEVSTRMHVKVHQYDCFDVRPPSCPTGDTLFHAECIGDGSRVEDGRRFDTLAAQMAGNGDATRRVVVKMDVEGAEWDSLLTAPDDVLNRIDQLAVEFHQVDSEESIAVVQRLKQFFHVVHLHFNNNSCAAGLKPFPAWAFEVLFVSKRLGVLDPGAPARSLEPIDAPNNPALPDCQVAAR
jgi:hypothetical protein